MYYIKVFLTFIASFMGLFFILSLIGLLWVPTYQEIISNGEWFIGYFMLIGWWVSLLITDEFHDIFN
jgi:hypothetical protein